MSKPVVLVTGANGQLGKELRGLADAYAQFSFVFVTREELPIEQSEQVREFFKKHQPAYCINCAAYTAVDKAETEKEKAFAVNGTAVGVLASASYAIGCKFVHVSTDYVFDGTSPVPYTETTPTNPVNTYGLSKLKGEALALLQNAASIVIRTAWVYSAFGNNFVKTMLRLMKDRPDINVVDDQVGAPTYAEDLATAIMSIVSKHQWDAATWQPGVYHYSNVGRISWYDFAVAIKELSGSSCNVHPIPSSQYPTPAKRPSFSLLNTDKIQAVYDLKIPEWKDSLQRCLVKIREQG
ncbi:MAG: dTDP-4-dehydrorhamnose reductase [Chitinophagaceae bacterium]